jgi:hypothetical protein
MNLKLFRKVHLYLGCFFAPLLVIFIASGVLQTFDLHQQKKNNSYTPPAWVETIAQLHQHQRVVLNDVRSDPSEMFRWFVLAMSVGLFINIALGVVMAFKFADPKVVWVVMILGIVVPVVILSVPFWYKT